MRPGTTERPRRSIRRAFGAHGHDSVATDRHRLGNRESIVDRDDLAVGQHEISLPRLLSRDGTNRNRDAHENKNLSRHKSLRVLTILPVPPILPIPPMCVPE
jgi:hypothetical protein